MTERGDGDEALITTIKRGQHVLENMKTAKLLQYAQATPGLVDVDELLAMAASAGWPDMCRILIVDAHADAGMVVKVSSSGRLELKEHSPKDRLEEYFWEPDEKVLEVIAACLSGAGRREGQETGNE